jgi:hypothetical protein
MHKDAYLLWKDNEVTKAFMREMKDGLNDHVNNLVWGTSIEEIGMNALIRKAKIEVIERVLEWKPEEVNDDSNN